MKYISRISHFNVVILFHSLFQALMEALKEKKEIFETNVSDLIKAC